MTISSSAAARRWTEQVLIGESSRKQNYVKVDGQLERPAAAARSCDGAAGRDGARSAIRRSAKSARAAHVSADLLVGLHCDGAAEPIVDFALALGKAFAIVPCCTCSKQFPRRRMNGAPVKSYDDLVAYLLAKDQRMRASTSRGGTRGEATRCATPRGEDARVQAHR